MDKVFKLLFFLFIPVLAYSQPGPGGVSTNLTLWFKGNSGTTTSGNNLTNWSDQSGSSFNITQGVAANQPSLLPNSINYNPAIIFDGGSDYLPISTKNYNGTGALSALTTLVVFETDFVGGAYNDNWAFLDYDRSDFFNMYIRGDNGRISFSYRSGGTTYDNDGATTGFNDGDAHLGVVSYNNANTNETIIRVDGLVDLSANRVANGATLGLSSTRYGFIGDGSEANTENGTRNNIYYDGAIAEVIHFERSLNASELNRVETYLAIKYGLTLGNTASPVSYLASDNLTTIWTGSATYQNGVAGIGRDDNSLLSQAKSSNSADNILAIEAESSFSSDLTFMVWGHDNAGNGLTTANLPAGFNQRLQKTWTVQNTGTPGSVTVDFIITNTGFNSYEAEDYTLLIDDNGNFTDGGDMSFTASSMIGDTVRFTGISLSSGEFFTLAGPSFRAPGGLSSGLKLWYRADAGVISSGGFVSSWKDNSAFQNHAEQTVTINQPSLLSSDFNYNASISFDDINDYLPITNISYTGAASLSQVLTMIVYKTNVSGGTNDNWAFLDFDRSEYFNFSIKGNGGLRFSYSSSNTIYDLDGATNGLNTDTPRLGVAIYDNSLTNETEIRTGGRRDYLNNNVATSATLGTTLTRFGIIGDGSEAGSFNGGSNGNYYGGEIAEIIYYDNQIFTVNQVQILESYLALKYGLSLSKNTNGNGTSLETPNSDGINEGDYLNSSGNPIWDASANNGYDNEVIGVGRDDDTGLLQKQSHAEDDSLRIYLQILQSSNTLNTAVKSDFGVDESFLVVGHNGAPQYDSGPVYGEWPTGVFSRVDREWKIQNTSFSGTFSLDITLDALSDISSVDPNDLVLMVDLDGNFIDAATYGTGDGLSISINTNTVTFGGITNAMIPSNSARYLAIGVTNASSPLPIELLLFKGEIKGQSVVLTWHVASEINNEFYTIEKSSNGKDWEETGTVQGVGDSEEEQIYRFEDLAPYRGISYYRLKQTDFNGNFEYFEPIAIYSKQNKNSMVFPNPVNNILYFNSLDSGELSVSLFNLSGNIIFQAEIDEKNRSIDTSTLKNGIYILVVNQEKHTIRIQHK